jgi:hypothetical protein
MMEPIQSNAIEIKDINAQKAIRITKTKSYNTHKYTQRDMGTRNSICAPVLDWYIAKNHFAWFLIVAK